MRLSILSALLIFMLSLFPAYASAEMQNKALTWSNEPLVIRSEIGMQTDIIFLPEEKILAASIDDSVQWLVETLPSQKTSMGNVQGITIATLKIGETNLDVKTSLHHYQIHLLGVKTHEANSQPLTLALNINLLKGDMVDSMYQDAFATYNTSNGSCPTENVKELRTVRDIQYAEQLTNAIKISNAVRKQSYMHVVFGVHALPIYILELGLEDLIFGRLTRKSCPFVKGFTSGLLGSSALYNALRIPK